MSVRRLGVPLAAGAVVAGLIAYPLVELFRTAIEEGWGAVRDALTAPGTGTAVVNTVWTGAAVAVLAVVAGAAAAFVTERTNVPGRIWLRIGMVLPLLIPPFVSALGFDRAYGPGGLTDDLFGLTLPGLFGPFGVVLVIAVNAVPLTYLVAAAGLASSAEHDLERSARASGAGPFTTLRTITFPLLRPALVAGGTLAFVVAVNSFGVPAVLGIPAGFSTMTTRIYQDLALSALPASFTRVVVLAAALVLIALVAAVSGDRLADAPPRTAAPRGAPPSGRRRRWPAAVMWTAIILTTILPFLALVLTALTRAVGLSAVPANWTLANFAEAMSGRAAGAMGRSLLLAALAAIIVLGLGGLAAAAGRRRGGRAVGVAAVLTFAVPGSALAVAMLLAYGDRLGDTLAIILLAYLAKFWALGHRPIAGSLDSLPADLPRAARVSGAGPWTALRTVIVPHLRPALVAAWLIVFLFAFHELTMSSLLYGPGTDTLAVVILNLRQLGDVTVTSATAVLLTLIVLAGAAALLTHRRARAVVLGRD